MFVTTEFPFSAYVVYPYGGVGLIDDTLNLILVFANEFGTVTDLNALEAFILADSVTVWVSNTVLPVPSRLNVTVYAGC